MDNNVIKIALAGNPNTGKSTVFNALTGLRQHTGNWSGKTVTHASGAFSIQGISFQIYDLPGIYSFFSDRAEERCAKEFICFEKPDITLVVLDSTCLERNLTLALQILELQDNVILCLNLIDEAKKKNIEIDCSLLSEKLGVPVLCTSARDGNGLEKLRELLFLAAQKKVQFSPTPLDFDESFGHAIPYLLESSKHLLPPHQKQNFFFSQVLEGDKSFFQGLQEKDHWDNTQLMELMARGEAAQTILANDGLTIELFRQKRSLLFLHQAEKLASEVSTTKESNYSKTGVWLDNKLLSGKTGFPLMLLLLGLIFWITIVGANYPSQLLMQALGELGIYLGNFLTSIHTPDFLYAILMDGVFLTVRYVVSVMLPPMAIFFPMFTLLEDFGLLPRIAFLLDGIFQRANAHGKQVLTMSMGFGCNAVGVTACRIIETPRERLIAILTNNFVPCNGRFPQPYKG